MAIPYYVISEPLGKATSVYKFSSIDSFLDYKKQVTDHDNLQLADTIIGETADLTEAYKLFFSWLAKKEFAIARKEDPKASRALQKEAIYNALITCYPDPDSLPVQDASTLEGLIGILQLNHSLDHQNLN